MQVYAELSLFVTICLCLATLGVGLCAICGVNWIDATTFNYGLWKYCFKYQTQTYSTQCYNIRDVIDVEGYSHYFCCGPGSRNWPFFQPIFFANYSDPT